MFNVIEKIFKSPTAPADMGVMWIDVSNPAKPVLKGYVNGAWVSLSDDSPEVQELWRAVSGKVDKEEGKGLSTNDYTNTDKDKVENIPANLAEILASKVNAEEGKGLSSNDYTDEDKQKLQNLEALTNTEIETIYNNA